jgi:two-component system CheB/CheR fusion protein
MPGSHPHEAIAGRTLRISKPRPINDRSGFPIVAIGASAGGLEACRKLLHALPADNGMAFVLVQHLDPSHDSMMVDLLAGHTSMAVLDAKDGMSIESEHVYVIPPGVYLSVDEKGALLLSKPLARHGARLPFDFLLNSLANIFGGRVVCVVLSGTGGDGSLGLRSVKANGGLVFAQESGEADYDGMPRSAIATGVVDIVLPAAGIADALLKRSQGSTFASPPNGSRSHDSVQDLLPSIVDLLRKNTVHDFTLYKHGTLERRIERRMAMAGIKTADEYLDVLIGDANELELLSRDLLINVTGFFRDASVFDLLADEIIPDIVRNHSPDRPLRIWIAGCSSGEETYSLTILFREEIASARRDIKLQVFASDVDPDAVASAREGLYPPTIEAEVSPGRLAAFFSKEDRSYRVSPELRSSVVFTVQDVLADPPFARLDFISCRNLLIYLRAEAQAKVASIFHFALRENGVLLVGSAEMVGVADGRFAVISKPARLYRRVGGNQPGEFHLSAGVGDGLRMRAGSRAPAAQSRQAAYAELCRTAVLDTYGPAAVLINQKYECLHFSGPLDRYLKVASGRPQQDLIAMARDGVRTKLRSAVQRALRDQARIVVTGGRTKTEAGSVSFRIDVAPAASDGEKLLLVCFVDEPEPKVAMASGGTGTGVPRLAELEHELEATKIELQSALRNLETSSEEQMAINEEALSVNEEYQSTNEELLASKEELQSLNEELNALNSQLQETLERQRTTADDLQNVLYSTDVATIFLDTRFNIRFFTPATKALFGVIASDVGRPLTDLKSLVDDIALLPDAQKVLESQAVVEREIKGRGESWFIRKILPYRTRDEKTEGVVIIFEDITERRETAAALNSAKRQAELASVAKSRFLAAASHDLRQPLQTLALLQGLLAKKVVGENAQKLVTRSEEALDAMTGMLNTLLDINQIEVGAVKAEIADFPVNDLLDRLRAELSYNAQAAGLALRVAPCRLRVRSDARLLEQMLRNLLSNALKYTAHGEVLVGCRRREGKLRIEVWDTGIGIPNSELAAIFEEYHQLDNAARQRIRGLGLGLSIVKRLGDLLGHAVRVRSVEGKGSVFSIEVPLTSVEAPPSLDDSPRANDAATRMAPRKGAILVIEDDPEVREHLELLLKDEGYDVTTAVDGPAALELAAQGKAQPDIVLADYNLPHGMNGVQVSQRLRQTLDRHIPFVILTGDISISTLRDIALSDCVQLNKPVRPRELTQAIEKLLASPPPAPSESLVRLNGAVSVGARDKIFVVDDDERVREAIRAVLEDDGWLVESYSSCEGFLEALHPEKSACLLIDAYLPGMSGLELLAKLRADGRHLPAIMITGNADVSMAVKAMKAGASDFIEKPVGREDLISSISRVLELSRDSNKLTEWRDSAASHLSGLTPRQREVMERVLAGHPNKNIAADLGISQRTVENHRASIMKRTGSKSLPALARLALVASGGGEKP